MYSKTFKGKDLKFVLFEELITYFQKELMLQFSHIVKESRCTTKNVKLSLNRTQRQMY